MVFVPLCPCVTVAVRDLCGRRRDRPTFWTLFWRCGGSSTHRREDPPRFKYRVADRRHVSVTRMTPARRRARRTSSRWIDLKERDEPEIHPDEIRRGSRSLTPPHVLTPMHVSTDILTDLTRSHRRKSVVSRTARARWANRRDQTRTPQYEFESRKHVHEGRTKGTRSTTTPRRLRLRSQQSLAPYDTRSTDLLRSRHGSSDCSRFQPHLPAR
jgi:hypothetical protein